VGLAGSTSPYLILALASDRQECLSYCVLWVAGQGGYALAMSAVPRKPVIGLLGGIGSGKSLVARQFEELGCGVVDADQLAREAYGDPAVIEQIVQWWGKAVIKENGEIDRGKIAGIVFENEEEKRRLEGLIHPKVLEARAGLSVQFQADAAVVAIVEDCPLLLEVGLDKACDVLIFVDSPRDQRLARVAGTRGWDEEELARREKNQMGLDKKADRADYVLKNDAGEAECFAHVRRVLSQILHQ